jgi:hypothetical protein
VVSFYTADQLQVTTSPDFDLSLGVNLITGIYWEVPALRMRISLAMFVPSDIKCVFA